MVPASDCCATGRKRSNEQSDHPPPAFKPLALAGRSTAVLAGIAQSMRFAAVRRSPLAYGWLMKRRDDAL